MSYDSFLKEFKTSAANVGASCLRSSPYGLRHGGASHDYAARLRDLLAIQRRGNWRTWTSVRRYEKSGRITLELNKLSAAVKQKVLTAQTTVASVFEQSS